MNKRDLILEYMGIKQWQLVKPTVMQGVVQLQLPLSTKLLLVTDRDLSNQDDQYLLQDICYCLSLTMDDIMIINCYNAQYIQIEQPLICCFVECETKPITSNLFKELVVNNWQQLKLSTVDKRNLWQQLQLLIN